ncbi:MAG TPA: class I SAM-dependent methyltransferase [Alphaproteobacteria bacterium]|jgi:SAM-dependent methyltransferase|nr:class I SAM-dependent methyltransferase [Alphaproteobacteria bacterium]MDP6270520.1 class I SAM-dependent methyltransferase [Alphaproteobacteria bacterium]MDP7428043.1 class I SAM-dependent methyltransferase [Alphaproteobacteria bacterium]HJM49208.1 class I SAM-dependent methyltransferase [Alphaproteobacteria bacterium]|tara:strand:+ start:185 stop:973 length:789 start_codon:yes stop_codon:yes gene_type:complete
MRITYRHHGGNQAYWRERWEQAPADSGGLNLTAYPGRFAEEALAGTRGPVLEAGCGLGRVLRHYHSQGREIVGLDFIASALAKIRTQDPGLPLLAGDVTGLPFADASFAAVLAFGVYHNLPAGVAEALAECRRVLTPGGVLCASVRADNLHNRGIDWLAARRAGTAPGQTKVFHKANFTAAEYTALLEAAGFRPRALHFVENYPLLYKFRAFRAAGHKRFDEGLARAEGYRLSGSGRALQALCNRLWPAQFCNTLVAIAEAA